MKKLKEYNQKYNHLWDDFIRENHNHDLLERREELEKKMDQLMAEYLPYFSRQEKEKFFSESKNLGQGTHSKIPQHIVERYKKLDLKTYQVLPLSARDEIVHWCAWLKSDVYLTEDKFLQKEMERLKIIVLEGEIEIGGVSLAEKIGEEDRRIYRQGFSQKASQQNLINHFKKEIKNLLAEILKEEDFKNIREFAEEVGLQKTVGLVRLMVEDNQNEFLDKGGKR